MFQRRHYEAIAKVFREAKPENNWCANKRCQHNLMLERTAKMMACDNDRFVIDRFIIAAGDYCRNDKSERI